MSFIGAGPIDFKHEVARGTKAGWTVWNKFGYNETVDTAASEIIAEFGGTFTPLTTGSTLTIVSASTADDNGSTGANSIVIYGVDSSWKEQTEVITMDGQTPVVTTTTWLGINRVAIYLCGSAKKNVGKITITATTGGSIQATIPATEGTTQQCIFFVPAKKLFLPDWISINAIKLSGGAKPEVNIKGYVYASVTNAIYEVYRETIDVALSNNLQIIPSQLFPISEKQVLYFTATTDTNATSIALRFSGMLAPL